MEKCLKIAKRLSLLGSKALSFFPEGGLAAGIIYTAGEDEDENGILGCHVAGEGGLKFICNFYNKPEYIVYGDYKNIKKLLRVDTDHPYGVPDYRNPSPVIRIFGIGSAGIKGVQKLMGQLKGTSFACISDDEDELGCLDKCEKILLFEDSNGAIIPQCTENITRISETSDVVFILLEPGSIDVLEGQALGAFVRSDNLKIVISLENNAPGALTAELIMNGMDASLKLRNSDANYNRICDIIDSIHSFPVFENEFNSGSDFFNLKILLKNSGKIKTITAISAGNESLADDVKKCASGVETSTLKGVIANIVGQIDMGLGEVQDTISCLKNLFRDLPVLYRNSANENTANKNKVTIIFVYK